MAIEQSERKWHPARVPYDMQEMGWKEAIADVLCAYHDWFLGRGAFYRPAPFGLKNIFRDLRKISLPKSLLRRLKIDF